MRQHWENKKIIRSLIAISFGLLVITSSIFIGQALTNNRSKIAANNTLVLADNNKGHDLVDPIKEDKKDKDNKNEVILDQGNKHKEEPQKPQEQKTSNMLKGGSNTTLEGDKYTFNAEEIEKMLQGTYTKDGKKVAFLTFDDGPSTTVTPKILETLKKYKVKATFFVLGKNIDAYPRSKEILKQILEDGHAIANHTYSHNYSYLYPGRNINPSRLIEDLEKNENAIKAVLGEEFKTKVVRLPGGMLSWKNQEEAKKELHNKGLVYIDWNSLNGDSEGTKLSAEQLVDRVKESTKYKEKAIILMHDTYGKENTAEALPHIIEYLQSQGYEFKTLN